MICLHFFAKKKYMRYVNTAGINAHFKTIQFRWMCIKTVELYDNDFIRRKTCCDLQFLCKDFSTAIVICDPDRFALKISTRMK